MNSLFFSTLRRAKSGSPLAALKELRAFARFPRTWNGVRGQFTTFEEATRSTPKSGKIGYDTKQHATLYDDRLGKILIVDYPVLFWLSRITSNVKSVIDIGGHKGELFYGFHEILPSFEPASWTVYDVPATVHEGRKLAETKQASALSFTSHLKDGSGNDLAIASGVLQYLEMDLATIVDSWTAAPRYILVNNTPMFEGDDYWTLQNTGLSYNPYRVFNRSRLIGSLEAQGYVLRDHWRIERSLVIPLRPELFVESYQGFFMEKSESLL